MDDFATWLQRQLDRREWTASDFARRANINPSIVSRWLRGTVTPSPASCDVIADTLLVDLDIVLDLAGHRVAPEPIDPDDPRQDLVKLLYRFQPSGSRLSTLRLLISKIARRPRRSPAWICGPRRAIRPADASPI